MPTVDVIVKGGKIVNHDGTREGSVLIEGEKIAGIMAGSELPEAGEVIDAAGLYVLPGLIDPHMHLQDSSRNPTFSNGDPVYTFEDNVRTESQSAAGGGVTTCIPMVFLRRDPGLSFLEIFEESKGFVEKGATVDFGFSGLITSDQHIEELPRYARELGMTTFKFMMAYRGEEAEMFGVRSVDDGQIITGFEQLAKLHAEGFPAWAMVHTENMDIVYNYKARLKAAGRQDLAAWTEARPSIAEEENLRRALFYAESTGAPLYVVHMTIGLGVDLVADAKARGVNVIAETCPHYLQFTKDDHDKIDILRQVNPPLRSEWDQERLWEGIRPGVISCMGSDQSTIMPVTEKRKQGLWTSIPGFPGTETMLSTLLHEGVNKGRIGLEKVVELCCYNNARVFGVYPQKGEIAVGSDADLVLVDLHKKVKVTPDILHSNADYTLLDGMEMEGWPTLSMVRGTVVMRDGEITGRPGHGTYIPRRASKSAQA